MMEEGATATCQQMTESCFAANSVAGKMRLEKGAPCGHYIIGINLELICVCACMCMCVCVCMCVCACMCMCTCMCMCVCVHKEQYL